MEVGLKPTFFLMETLKLLQQVEQKVQPVLGNLGFILVERELIFQHGQWILRLYIDREGAPIGLEDCETASRALEGVLDVENIIPHRYSLEVSSPGLSRPLRYARDFERFAGNRVEVTTQRPLEGRSNFSGTLKGLKENKIILEEGIQIWEISLDDLKKAKIKYAFKQTKENQR